MKLEKKREKMVMKSRIKKKNQKEKLKRKELKYNLVTSLTAKCIFKFLNT